MSDTAGISSERGMDTFIYSLRLRLRLSALQLVSFLFSSKIACRRMLDAQEVDTSAKL
jgi:hypothetical protein